jgi:phosphatidate cytidylyltransferase
VWGAVAIPAALLLTMVALLVFYALVPNRTDPLLNCAITMLGVAWIAGTGALAMTFLEAPHFRWLIFAVVLIVAVMDMAQYFTGRAYGRHPLAPVVSPKKTVEGLVGGVVAAVAMGALFGLFEPFDLGKGLFLGAAFAVFAPLGDLAVSLVKRSIGVKDMGSILPGHGGVLDRIDAILFAIAAAWLVFTWTGLLG